MINNKSVLIITTSDRGVKLTEPLKKIGDDVTSIELSCISDVIKLYITTIRTDPESIIVDSLGFALLSTYVISIVTQNQFIIRFRGDGFREYKEDIKCAKVSKRPVVLLISWIKLLISKVLVRKAGGYIFVSNNLMNEINKEHKLSGPSEVVQTPYEVNTMACTKKSTDNESNNEIICLTVTNLDYWGKYNALKQGTKNMEGVLNSIDNIRYIVAGDGRYLQNYKDDVKNVSNVFPVGYVSEIEQLYKKADIFIYFSCQDGYPSVVLEASSYKLPIIVNSHGALTEQIKNGESGIVVDLDNKQQLEESVIRLVRSQSRRTFLGKNAYNNVQNKNSMSTIGRKLHKAIVEIEEYTT